MRQDAHNDGFYRNWRIQRYHSKNVPSNYHTDKLSNWQEAFGSVQFYRNYNEEIHDLLGKDIKARMDLKESPDHGVFVKDLSMNIVKTEAEMQKYMDYGFKNRAVR